MSGYIDFGEVKERVSIEQAVQKLGLKVSKSGNQLRGPCPACRTGGDRALAITPAKNLFYCFALQAGGDQIQLVAHVHNVGAKEAAEWLGGEVRVPSTRTSTSTGTVSKERAAGFQPLDYLQVDHAAVEAIGFDQETAKAVGIGFAPKGLMRGLVAVPVRLEDGTLAGYIGITEAKLPPKFHLISNVVPFEKKTA
jgi:DNA primase